MTSDVLMIGGGVISMAIAIELKLRGAQVTVVSRDLCAAATHAAAGMLAPGAERISDEAMQKLCTRSLYLYPDWTRKLEEFTSINTGYWSCGILAPVYQEQTSRASTAAEFPSSGVWRGQINSKLRSVALAECATNSEATQSQNSKSRSVASGAKQSEISPSSGSSSSSSPSSPAYWLEKEAIHQYQSGLGEEVVGGWWYPEDGQVNNRALAQALLATAKSLGVELKEDITVEGIQQQQRQVVGVQTSAGILHAEHYVLATGAWSNALFPLPVRPVKGQMLSVRVPEFVPDLPLTRVLFGEDIYIVPRRDGRIIIGATVEDVGFTPYNTPVGIQALLQRAIRLFPKIQDYPIEEFWWGFRPATPDELPILGTSPCENLTFATGHYRNGILLAPITATLLADLILEQKIDSLLSDFHYSRFHAKSSTPMLTYPTHRTQNLELSTQNSELSTLEDSPLQIAGKTFQSRLMTGTGKYRSIQEMQQSVAASRCQIVTVAVRRVQTNAPGHEGLAEALDWTKIWMLPNTAGCKTAEEAIRVARLGREMAKLLGQEDNNFVKLEVIPDQKYLLPDPIGTLQAAEQLVKEGFAVLPYINADPMLAKHLEEAGCATVMPLASPIGSGQGLKTAANIQIIIENAHVPVVVDAGIGAPSEAAQAMEMGADALLINSAIALAQNPPAMAHAMNLAAVAGRLAYLAGRMPLKSYAIASSPLTGTITN